jgi:hypothetical protein
VKGSPPPAWVVDDTPPIALVGVDETVPPTELLVVSRVVVVSLAVVVVAPLVDVAPEVLVAPLVVVVPLTVVVVAPLVVVAPPVVVVPLTVVVVAPLVVVAPEVVVWWTLVVVVGLTLVVVVVPPPPEVLADASWVTLSPASTITATTISQAAVRPRTFCTCLAIDPYLLLPKRPFDRAPLNGTNKTAASCRSLARETEQHRASSAWSGHGGC